MNISTQLSKHFRETFTGGNWSEVDFTYALDGVDLELATRKNGTPNSIVMLVAHIHFYIIRVLKVLNGGPLLRGEQDSFVHPALHTEEDWSRYKATVMCDAEAFAESISELPEEIWDQVFVEEKYGSYFRNITGIIEHSYYHIGQIVVLKKLGNKN